MKSVDEILSGFDPVSLEEMDQVKLLSRMDTKFMFHEEELPGILEQVAGQYSLLTIEGHRYFTYHSLYFDTPRLDLYLSHHNGERPRYKIRYRKYQNTGRCYFEIKCKTNRERTIKSRIEVRGEEFPVPEVKKFDFPDKTASFLQERIPFAVSDLEPSLWTYFDRLTLVNKNGQERITIDTGLRFEASGKSKLLTKLAVCEVKRDRLTGNNAFIGLLKSRKIYPANMSKYSIGSTLVKENLKVNSFKSKLLTLKKNGYVTY